MTDAVIFTPPANSYIVEPTELLPALRALEGSGWFGLPGIPLSLKDASKTEDISWIRVAEAAHTMITAGKKWVAAYEIHGEAGPTQLAGMLKVLEAEGVVWQMLRLRGMRIGIITYKVQYEHGGCEDLEHLYEQLVRLIRDRRAVSNVAAATIHDADA